MRSKSAVFLFGMQLVMLLNCKPKKESESSSKRKLLVCNDILESVTGKFSLSVPSTVKEKDINISILGNMADFSLDSVAQNKYEYSFSNFDSGSVYIEIRIKGKLLIDEKIVGERKKAEPCENDYFFRKRDFRITQKLIDAMATGIMSR